MHVPETTVNEDNFFARMKNEVRLSREVGSAKTVAISETMNKTADTKFG